MSRTGCCYDNAVMERFFWSLKHEWTNHAVRGSGSRPMSVFKYIETFYNSAVHQTLGYLSPVNTKQSTDHAPASRRKLPPRRCPKVLG